MHIQNLEPALRRAMVSVFRQKGLSEVAANVKASANMAAADALFHEKCDEDRSGSEHRLRNSVDKCQYALRQVSVWAHSL